MWRKRIAMVAVLAALFGMGAVPPTVRAGGRNEPIYGDVNGDGFTDQVFLGIVQPDRCSVIVKYGRDSGGFGPPIAYAYLRPGGTGLGTVCPDLGVAVELTQDGIDDLVIAWFAGRPPSISYSLLVLGRDFQPDFGLTESIFQPSFMGKADFNGDGRMDVYAFTDQGQGFETYLSLGDGTLTPGPEKWCAGPMQPHLHDFNLNGAMDVLISYIESCADFSSGVVVVRDDGSVAQLERDEFGVETWTARAVQANGDRFPDVRTQATISGQIDHFIGVGNGSFVLSPRAVTDTVTVSSTKKTAINILGNDYATNEATVTIVTPPRYGKVQVTADRTVVFTPSANPGRTDRFVYQLSQDGKKSTAAVNLQFQN
jgi:hypothetical protein